MENKQTAVEWLYDTIIIFPETIDDLAHNARSLKQAKEMHKEQIIDAFMGYETYSSENLELAELYYKEQYGTSMD